MSYRNVNPTGAKELLDSDGFAYLDVRTVEEFEAGHAPGAFNIPVAFRGPAGMELNDGFAEAVKRAFQPEAKLLLGCAAGVRSAHACEILANEGYETLVNMHGGFSGARDPMGTVTEPGWQACGFDVTTDCEDSQTWTHLSLG